jgi:ALG6, ALG8 glycosyltransferase family
MHGLALWGAYFMMTNQLELAVVSMVLALNFKQMALYFGLPFAFFALAKIWNKSADKTVINRLMITSI